MNIEQERNTQTETSSRNHQAMKLSDIGGGARHHGDQRIVIVAVIDPVGASPRVLRQRFAEALRDAVQRSLSNGHIDIRQAEELIRALPALGLA
jgi:hypothetical protein